MSEFTTWVDSLHDKIDFIAPVNENTLYIAFTVKTQTGKRITKIQLTKITNRKIVDIIKDFDNFFPEYAQKIQNSKIFDLILQ